MLTAEAYNQAKKQFLSGLVYDMFRGCFSEEFNLFQGKEKGEGKKIKRMGLCITEMKYKLEIWTWFTELYSNIKWNKKNN